jgi:hypothetical protein
MKIELHKQFKVPIDGLNGLIPIAEEVIVKKKKKNAKNAFEEDSQSDEEVEEEDPEDQADEKEVNPRKAAKKLMKAEKR